jgi:putative heme iron utilization protein
MSAKDDTPPFTKAEVAGMVAHMNEDHADSVLAYAQHFGNCPGASEARLLDVTPTEMQIKVRLAAGSKTVVIAFDHRLESSHDAHMTIIKMSKAAKRARANS